MSEESYKREQELKRAFAEIFPLANDRDLPWAACQIGNFLKKRIALEVGEQTRHFTTRVVKILCEQSPPRSTVEDMAREVVCKAAVSERHKEALHAQVLECQKLKERAEELLRWANA